MDSQQDLPFSAASPGSKKDKQPWTAKILVSLCLGLLLFYALTKVGR